MELYEIRNTTKKLLREGAPTSVEYEKALPLCKELFDAFPETHDLWDVQQYANCLKKLNRLVKMSIQNSKIQKLLKPKVRHFYT